MCGISGIISFNAVPDRTVLESMSRALQHRGPDDNGIKCFDRVALAHRRLAIIDLDNGRQPLSNEDGTVWIVFNGEIYNHLELRSTLNKHQFRTACDTEVIVHLYEEYGEDAIAKLDGMFALAIYDRRNDKLLLARDRLGQKPLYYFISDTTMAFASELSALKQHPERPRQLNYQALHDYFSLQYIPAPATIYQHISKLPPAHTMTIDLNSRQTTLKRYWQLDFSHKTDLSFDAASEKLRQLLTQAVKKRLMSDVPYGAFLSGGLDSTIITALMSQLCPHSVKTFTIGFEEKLYDERQYARQAAEAVNRSAPYPIEHHIKTVNPDDFELLQTLVRHYGEPYSDASMLPTFMLSKFTREQITVVLSGDGADEMFAGYERYLVMKYAAMANAVPGTLRRTLAKTLSRILPAKVEERSFNGRLQRLLALLSDESHERYFNIINRFPDHLKYKLYGEALQHRQFTPAATLINSAYQAATSPHYLEKLLETDIHTYLPGDILTKVDIASMACSLELRSPFMDFQLVEFAASLPFNYKQSGNSRKHILKHACRDIVPEQLLKRGKKGFGVPIAAWFRNGWREQLTCHLLEGEAVKQGFLQRAAVEELLRQHCSLHADYSYPLWAMLIFELFLEQEKER